MVIKVSNLSKDYVVNGQTVNIFKNICFEASQGDVVIIAGPSGVGKSTLLRCINRLETPTGGEITFLDKSIYDYSLEEIRQNIGMVFQNYNLFNHLSVQKNIMLAPVTLKLMNKIDAQKKAEELLKKLNIFDKINSYPCDLSGGQKQRVGIARALIMNPKIMLFDEPTSALDPKTSQDVAKIIENLADKGMTVLVVTHETEFFKDIATTIVNIKENSLA